MTNLVACPPRPNIASFGTPSLRPFSHFAPLQFQASLPTKFTPSLLSLARTKAKTPPVKSPLVRIELGQFKSYKPVTPGLRHRRLTLRTGLWNGRPIRKLTVAKRKTGGRNYTGRVVCRHHGGGHRRRIRLVDFYRREPGLQKVVRIEYDPGRTANIALLRHKETKALSYILAPEGLKRGDEVESLMNAPASRFADEGAMGTGLVRVGNCMPLAHMPIGSTVHCIGLRPGDRARMARAAGTWAQVLYTAKTGYAQLRLGSGEVRKVPVEACATIGRAGNSGYRNEREGKAGVGRWKGRRPTVRGMAMNACDHPHGGGRGKSKGNKHPRSPWGVLAKGGKTRKKPHPMMIKPRPRR